MVFLLMHVCVYELDKVKRQRISFVPSRLYFLFRRSEEVKILRNVENESCKLHRKWNGVVNGSLSLEQRNL